MSLVMRTSRVLLQGLNKPKLQTLDEEISNKFRVQITDLDFLFHMNNAKYLNCMEAARWDLALRSGVLQAALKNGWSMPISRISIQYLRPLQLFNAFEIRTSLVHTDAKWMFMQQRFISEGKEITKALVRSTFISKRGPVALEEVQKEIGYDTMPKMSTAQIAELNAWLHKFEL